MDSVLLASFKEELLKIAMARIKSNDRMPARTQTNVNALVTHIKTWDSPHKAEALHFMEKVGPRDLFDILHSCRRWYSGQTMARKLLEHRDSLGIAMKLDPKDAVGIYRGFKVDNDSHLAKLEVGQQLTIPVTRNHGFSSWSTSETATNRFSGSSPGKTGLIIKLVSGDGVKPVLAPPSHTEPWFNALYEHAIGKSFRPTEGEYLIHAPEIKVEVVRVKRGYKTKK